jgi:multiple sugar transport system substrate-binding protein
MYDKAIKDMEAQTGIYDMVYIEQDIIYAYLSRDFLVDMTKACLADKPALKAPNYDEANFTTFADYFKNARRRPVRHADGGLHQDLPLPDRPVQRPRDPGCLQGQDRQGSGARDHARRLYRDRRVLHRIRQGKGRSICGARPPRPIPATRRPGTNTVESVAPTFGVYNWGIDANNNYAATVEHGGTMNSPEAKEALKYWLHLRDIAPPESATQSTWTETATTFAAGRAAQGLIYGENAGVDRFGCERSRRWSARSASPAALEDEGVLAAGRGRQGLHRLL